LGGVVQAALRRRYRVTPPGKFRYRLYDFIHGT
jgi:hypothetical protein